MTLDAAPRAAASEVATIAANLARIRERIAQACDRAGRDPAGVNILAVTKTKPVSTVLAAAEAGLGDVGENYPQELIGKYEQLGDAVRWHMIGHMQRNKARAIVPIAAMIHSLDSARLADEIDRQAKAIGRRIPVLVQANTSGEASKHGAAPEETLALVRYASSLPNLDVQGLMTIAAFLDDAEALRPMFRLLRTLRDEAEQTLAVRLPHLSMGMTGDFETAIEEGATYVRIGTALFGPRVRTDT